jgi:hypothetical protein
MTERLQPPPGSDHRGGRRRTPRRTGGRRDARTVPVPTPSSAPAESEPNLFGLPAEIVPDDAAERSAGDQEPTVLPADLGLVAVRRADRSAGAALVLAGVAANMSLSLSWSPGEGFTGLTLVQRGVEVLSSGLGESVDSAVWQPLVVVLCGGLLVLLGFLALIPARAHRAVGVLALLVALAAAAAVAVLMADGGWGPDQFGPGMWCAVAVPILGGLGALKAMLTAPQLTIRPR